MEHLGADPQGNPVSSFPPGAPGTGRAPQGPGAHSSRGSFSSLQPPTFRGPSKRQNGATDQGRPPSHLPEDVPSDQMHLVLA